ncbi:MAG: CBS domain-containing protein [Desulfosarcinaceae bacterium]|nr:CBS domain-containing protein [Desulfosarcinaceae bacterium]
MNRPTSEKTHTLITTHINADFDALASMLAAQKLYPQAVVVFPGSQERNLRNFFIQSMVYLYNMVDLKKLDASQLKRLVLVDTRRADRIGAVADLLELPGLEIHIYDHHPSKHDDIRGQYEVLDLTGATVTILTELIQKKRLAITAEEATIMCLGIYEDTGSFTFPSTTARDFQAAAYLVSKGANLNTVAGMITREISPEQVGLLNDLIQAARHYDINGVDVVVARLSVDNYVPDLAFLVHKMVKMENINAIFVLALMDNKIQLVARSRIRDVDAGAIVTAMGGGGHPYAASASIKDRTLAQAEQELFKLLQANIRSRRQARHLMSEPAISVDEGLSCEAAKQMLTRYNINALLVTGTDLPPPGMAGYITRQVIEKAIYHQLGHVPVSEYTTTELESVSPDADLVEIQNKIIENKQRLLPVVNGESVLGVITRTDLLNTLVHQQPMDHLLPPDPTKRELQARTRYVLNFMRERLPQHLMRLLEDLGKTAAEIDAKAYVVGGFVRDLFLYRSNEDIDIVIEGDGIAFARTYAKRRGARIHAYHKFGTAVIIMEDGFKIDVASARTESYKFPAALPDVEMSSIKLDLYRRDFTINTLAIQLNPDRLGRLIDFFSAQKDIKDKAIRVLHNLSFVEDPTRVFRAIRFEQRFGFSIGRLTIGLINNAVRHNFFKRLGGRRVFGELRQILEEVNPVPALTRMAELNLLQVIHPSLVLDKAMISQLEATQRVIAWRELLFIEEPYLKWAVYFMVLTRPSPLDTAMEIGHRLELAPRHVQAFCRGREAADHCLYRLHHRRRLTNSYMDKALNDFRTELILYMMAATNQDRVKRAISHYFTNLRHITLSVTGRDLKALGLPAGPAYRQILAAVRESLLDGRIKGAQQERNLLRRLAKKHLKKAR